MRILFAASGAVLVASLFFGGAARRDVMGNLVPVVLSCGLLAVSLYLSAARLKEDRFLRVLVAALVLLLVVQFILMPPSMWGVLPGRRELLQMYADSGVAAPWSALALRPAEAAQSVLALLPGLALCLSVISLTSEERLKLVFIMMAAAVVSVPVGMLQIMGEQSGPLYFFDVTNRGSAVGFFANRNHYAALFYCSLPFVAATFASRKQISGAPLWMLGAFAAFVMILGLSISGSRSALVLGPLALLASALYVAKTEVRELLKGRGGLVVAGVAILLVLPIALGAGLLAIFQRLEMQDLADDDRWTFAQVTLEAIRAYFPVGAGLGSFQQVYQLFEPPSTVSGALVNHAHNDWLELALELGLPGLALACAFVGWLVFALTRCGGQSGSEARLARAALVAVTLLVLHSLWDYPLRTIALSTLLGLCIGLTFRPGADVANREARGGHRRRGRSSKRRSAEAAA